MDPRQAKPFISIVIPVFNSEAGLALLIDELAGTLSPSFRLQIILVNDASTDRSEEVCLELYKKHSGLVQVLSLAENVGEQNAVMAGLKQARGDCAVVMDDDGQNPPSQVPILVDAALGRKYDVVYGAYKRKEHPLWRNLASALYNAAARLLLKKPAGLYLSSFKAVHKSVLTEIIKDESPAPLLDALILRTARRVGQVTVEHAPRKTGSSGYSVRKLIAAGFRLVSSSRRAKPKKNARPQFIVRRSWEIEREVPE